MLRYLCCRTPSHFLRAIRTLGTSPDVNAFTTRSHNCGELRMTDIGKKVEVHGWLLRKRLNFLVIHDKYGFVQAKLVNSKQLGEFVDSLGLEDVVRITGTVVSRGKDVNPKMDTGDIEIEIESLEKLNDATPLPFPIFGKLRPLEDENEVEHSKRLSYRYLDLRKRQLQHALHLRAEVVRKMRRCFEDRFGFIDVETPTLATHTPGGAAEFIVPTPAKGLAYALPQSPQLYKQLLMIGQIDRYYQIARCYRDETVRGDRQPEFTQVDFELSFTNQEGVMSLIEQLILDSWPAELSDRIPTVPFRRLSFDEVMTKYGSDKPDLRLPWEFVDCSGAIGNSVHAYGFVVRVADHPDHSLPSNVSLKRRFSKLYPKILHKFSTHEEIVGRNPELSRVLQSSPGDLVITAAIADPKQRLRLLETLGQARNFLGDILGLRTKEGFTFAWVLHFPLFVPSEDNPDVLESAHHPFTAPIPEHLENLRNLKDLESIRAQHYDLVVNGIEMGGGSIRIHQSPLQRLVFEKILHFPTDTLEDFLEALSFGAPPHGGFAFGLDRYISCLAARGSSKASVKDVIAFPKTNDGKCHMMKTPFAPDSVMLDRYGLQFVKQT